MMAIAFLGYLHSLTWYDTTSIMPYGYSLSYLSVLPLTRSPRCDSILKSLDVQPSERGAVFENLHTQGCKANVSECIKPLAGVYLIINLNNGNIYVGSAITGCMPNRFHKHLFGLNGSKLVAAAVAKYGLANFAFVVVDTIPSIVKQEDNKALLEMEDHYIQRLLPDYNIAAQAGNTFGVKHTEDTKLKMRINYSSERREAIGSLNRGKKLPPATVERIRAAALARSPMKEETREKVSANSSCANLYLVSRVADATVSNGITNITPPAGELFLRLQNSVTVAKKQFNEHYEVLVLLRIHGKLL
jgi:group I intron endonuclease